MKLWSIDEKLYMTNNLFICRCDLQLGDEVSAASALLRSAQCYSKLEDIGTFFTHLI